MNHSPESLARAFHNAYARAAARAYGSQREPEPWEALSEQARTLMLEASATVLGVEPERKAMAAAMPVPSREEFAQAIEAAESEGDVSEGGDWRAEIEGQIEAISAPRIRRAFRSEREPFKK